MCILKKKKVLINFNKKDKINLLNWEKFAILVKIDGCIDMRSKNVKHRKRKTSKHQLQQHKRSMVAISAIILLLSVVMFIGGFSLKQRNDEYIAVEASLQEQIDAEVVRSEEIDELKEYVGTDEYIESVAKEKLGLVYKNEILFRAE